jgi:hypothetical protein
MWPTLAVAAVARAMEMNERGKLSAEAPPNEGSVSFFPSAAARRRGLFGQCPPPLARGSVRNDDNDDVRRQMFEVTAASILFSSSLPLFFGRRRRRRRWWRRTSCAHSKLIPVDHLVVVIRQSAADALRER